MYIILVYHFRFYSIFFACGTTSVSKKTAYQFKRILAEVEPNLLFAVGHFRMSKLDELFLVWIQG